MFLFLLTIALSSNAFTIDYLDTQSPQQQALQHYEMMQFERDLNQRIDDNYNSNEIDSQRRIDKMIDETNHDIETMRLNDTLSRER
ncbi:MAG: hypothetical protein WBI40_13060 [Methylococcaceae bacterium]